MTALPPRLRPFVTTAMHNQHQTGTGAWAGSIQFGPSTRRKLGEPSGTTRDSLLKEAPPCSLSNPHTTQAHKNTANTNE